MQAQPNKLRLEARDEQKYVEKLLAKATVIADSANRIWRKLSFLAVCLEVADRETEAEMQQELDDEYALGHLLTVTDQRTGSGMRLTDV